MFFKEYKTVSPYFGVSKRSKNFFRIRKKKEVRMKKNSQQKNCVPFFGISTFGGLFSLIKIIKKIFFKIFVLSYDIFSRLQASNFDILYKRRQTVCLFCNDELNALT